MQQFNCQCGQAVFFDSEYCVQCHSRLGFNPHTLTMLTLTQQPDGSWLCPGGGAYRLCDNGVNYGVCNWLRSADEDHGLCRACQFNRTVPNQGIAENQYRWRRLEEGKKRLFYTLMQLNLPLVSGWEDPDKGLLLDFIEDELNNQTFPETFVHTGYLGGVITINALEADDTAREYQRRQMNERYRTVLGHLRHESGHYYWQLLAPDEATCDGFRAVFGDDSRDYGAALETYYRDGPQTNWETRYISAYASAHPAEDWAESWGHYLHIYDALETAAAHKLTDTWPGDMNIASRIALWRGLSISLNELNRSVGRGDAYPFLLNAEVEKKLVFVDGIIRQLQSRHPATAAY